MFGWLQRKPKKRELGSALAKALDGFAADAGIKDISEASMSVVITEDYIAAVAVTSHTTDVQPEKRVALISD
jgi:hypothetical protein